MENGVRIQMMELDSIVEKKTTETIRGRQGQPSLNKVLEKDQFIGPLIQPLIPVAARHWMMVLS
jgi:hypothetical protein